MHLNSSYLRLVLVLLVALIALLATAGGAIPRTDRFEVAPVPYPIQPETN